MSEQTTTPAPTLAARLEQVAEWVRAHGLDAPSDLEAPAMSVTVTAFSSHVQVHVETLATFDRLVGSAERRSTPSGDEHRMEYAVVDGVEVTIRRRIPSEAL